MMNRRQLLGLVGGTAVSTVVVGAVAPPAQAFVPLIFRLLFGAAVRSSLKETAAARKQAQLSKRVKPRSKVRRRGNRAHRRRHSS